MIPAVYGLQYTTLVPSTPLFLRCLYSLLRSVACVAINHKRNKNERKHVGVEFQGLLKKEKKKEDQTRPADDSNYGCYPSMILRSR